MTTLSSTVSAQPCLGDPTVACGGPLTDAIEKPNCKQEVHGQPYDYSRLGAPRPPCESERAITADLVLQQYFNEGRLQSDPDFGMCCTLFIQPCL